MEIKKQMNTTSVAQAEHWLDWVKVKVSSSGKAGNVTDEQKNRVSNNGFYII